MQQKTQRPVQFELTEQTRDAVAAWIAQAQLRPEQYLFQSRVSKSPHLSTRQYSRIVELWVASIGLDAAGYGTHSLRRTKATLTATYEGDIDLP
jgi:integrase